MARLRYDYDYKNNSLFVYSSDPYEYDVSIELDNDVTLDLDINSKPVAFEFLNASELFNLDKGYFKNLVSITIQAAITEENICLNVQLVAIIHNNAQIFDASRITSNLNNIPAIETQLITV
ncbi:MAG: DUF2283 domain-containing protein [Methanobrevibacter sp.]|uniref:DUF2283 domain-containing protein n=1 Tax=Methanobrevibacter sp. TaxID=66852 RepID=UPI0025E6A34A|nr:DUF2283 domain-containing protein [Methanobrevibacter sp.]MBQ8017827.1 DUF2283 domain-containing protein [Methanobrevibacter sp.]